MGIKKILFLMICFCGLSSFQKPKFQQGLSISLNQTIHKIPKSITVQIVNSENFSVPLSNLIFEFYIDDDKYYGIFEKLRFLDKALLLDPNQKFSATINFDSLNFTSSVKNSAIPLKDVKNKMRRSKKTVVMASMDDPQKLRNLLESSSLIWSNSIELIK